MADFTCNACGGRFTSPGADGVPYFHVCPPFSTAELRAGKADALPDPGGARAALIAAAAVKPVDDPVADAPRAKAEATLAQIQLRRPGHVDQNPAPGQRRQASDKTPVDVVSVGAGVTGV